jgi:hypothetical protein
MKVKGEDKTPGQPGRLIVCERAGQWAVALRQELAATGIRVWETRSLADCWDALADSPAAFLIVELRAENTGELLRRMAQLQREFPLARIAVVAARRLAAYEWLVREAGAIHFTCSARALTPLTQAAVRHLAGVPVPQQGLAERIWASLPWSSD